MELELVSLDVCPFVQRSAITLNHKGAAYDITYIDLDDPPEWFARKSPLGKVPILIVRDDQETVLFESAVINEFVDKVSPGSMISEDPLQQALDKAWIEFASELLQHIYQLILAKDQDAFDQHRAGLEGLLQRLEQRMGEGPFWHGQELSLVDAAFAPALQRLRMLGLLPAGNLSEWTDALLATDAVRESVPADFEARHDQMVQQKGGIINQWQAA